jgi:hypothetical protein
MDSSINLTNDEVKRIVIPKQHKMENNNLRYQEDIFNHLMQ